jgi:hypothetical protein
MEISLDKYINKSLNNKHIQIFHSNLVENHMGVMHPIKEIPANFTLLDALCYVFDNDAMSVASVLQSYQDGIYYARELMKALEEGIRTKSICLRCIRENMKN